MRFLKFSFLSVILVSIFLLNSCDNFSQGVKLKEQLEYEIWLSKQMPLTVEGYSPQNTGTAVYKNSSIIITFSNSMDIESAVQLITIGVDEEDDSFKQNYNDPIWENDNKTVKFIANEYNLVNESNLPSLTICVNIHKGIKDANNVPLAEDKIFHFKVNDTLDNTCPVFETVKFGLSEKIIEYIPEDNFIAGELTDDTLDDILTTNITNETAYIYLEGHDYGGGKVSATLSCEQIYDAEGYSVTIEKDEYKFDLHHKIQESNNYCCIFPLSLEKTDKKAYSDGLYKITIQLEDEVGNVCENPRIYYVIRDTILELSSNAYLCNPLPDLRQGTTPDWDIVRSINGIEESVHQFGKGNFTSDVYFKYRKNGTVRKYYTDWIIFPTKISYGISYGNFEVNNEELYQDEFGNDIFSENFIEYLYAHENQNVYVREYLYDAAGNSTYKDVCIPGKPEVMYWDYNSSTGSVNVHIIDKSDLDISTVLGMNNVNAAITYNVYFAKKDSATDIKDTVLTRNALFSTADYYEDLSDSFEIKIDPSSEYIVGIQTKYKFFSITGGWLGTTLSNITVLDNVSAKNSSYDFVKTPEFTYSKINNGINTGTFTIKINYSNKQSGVKYYPAWSTDGENYTYYEADSENIIVPTLMQPPLEWNSEADITSYTNKAYLKIVGLKGTTTVSSEIKEIEFTEEDDNTPPALNTYSKNHAIGYFGSQTHEHALYDVMRNLGQSEYRNFAVDEGGSFIIDSEFHLKKEFTYYWEPYRSAWGNSLEVYTAEQIENIQNKRTGNLQFDYGTWSGKLERYASVVIPLEGFDDGDYMIFIKVEDTKGNYTYGTIGKTHIGSYANVPVFEYSAEKDLLTAKLNLSTDENFDTTEIKVGYVNVPAVADGEPEIGYRWELFNNDSPMTKEGSTLTFSHNTNNLSEWVDWYPRCRFYRVQTYSYNEDSRYKGFDTDDNPDFDYDVYDRLLNKTVSAPAFVYVNLDDSGNILDTTCKQKYFTSSPAYAPMLLCDQPVLYQIIKCYKDLGNDIHEWERRGTVIDVGMYNDEYAKNVPDGTTVFSKDCTSYTQVDTSAVNSVEGSFYYVVTVHYADNTSDVSCVYYKK